MSALLEIYALTARYGQITALTDVSIQVGPGEVVALLGANGAGKSTLMKAIMGLVKPATGGIRFGDRDLASVSTADRARLGLGYSPEGRRVFPGMTVRENLEVACHDGAAAMRERIAEVFALFPALAERACADDRAEAAVARRALARAFADSDERCAHARSADQGPRYGGIDRRAERRQSAHRR